MLRLLGVVILLLLVVTAAVFASPTTNRYDVITTELKGLEAAHSTIAQIFSIGKNNEGVDILALRVSVTPQQMDPKKVGHLLVATHHGNEPHAALFAIAFIRDLIKRFESDELWTSYLPQSEWTIIPVLNISGYNEDVREEYDIDPNRDYPNPCLPQESVGKLASVQRLMELFDTRTFSGSITVHGYLKSLSYPWGTFATSDKTLDHSEYDRIFAKAARFNGYPYGTGTSVVYSANGCFEDWVYWRHGAWSMLIELDSGSPSDIKKTVRAVASYFDDLSSSPSNQHEFSATCTEGEGIAIE